MDLKKVRKAQDGIGLPESYTSYTFTPKSYLSRDDFGEVPKYIPRIKKLYRNISNNISNNVENYFNTVTEDPEQRQYMFNVVDGAMGLLNNPDRGYNGSTVSGLVNMAANSKHVQDLFTKLGGEKFGKNASATLGVYDKAIKGIEYGTQKQIDTLNVDQRAIERMGSGYGNATYLNNVAENYSGKTVGGLTNVFTGEVGKGNKAVKEATDTWGILADISKEEKDKNEALANMTLINGVNYHNQLNGNIGNRAYMSAYGEDGMKLKRLKKIDFRKSGGNLSLKINPDNKGIEWQPIITYIEKPIQEPIEKFQKGGKQNDQYNVKDLLHTFNYEDIEKVSSFKDKEKTLEQEWSEDPIEYTLQRFPILSNFPTVNLQYDPNFYPNEIGNYGNLEYMNAEHDTLPYYRNYRKLNNFKGQSVIVYNDEVNNEDIALDWLSHGLREYDSKWNEYLQRLAEDPVWKRQITDELFGSFLWDKGIDLKQYRKLSRSQKKKLEEEFDNTEINPETFNSILDGLIRGLLVRRDTESSESYAPENLREELQNTKIWKEVENYLNINKTQKHEEGGVIQQNIIPEGALHARKNNIETDLDITSKGIPVVTNEGDQTAEIERNEIIYSKEVTEQLEDLCNKYYSDDYTQAEKDQFAIEAGDLLVNQTLFNTKDMTGLIETTE